MKLFRKPPWYAAGLAFQCSGCGDCCAGPAEGYVWVLPKEIAAIAAFLGLSPAQTRSQYIRRVGGRLSLVERKDNNDCIFLVPREDGGKKCAIYSVRPSQCRTWPFWPGNLRNPEDWALATTRCSGMNQGKLHPCQEIDAQRKATGH